MALPCLDDVIGITRSSCDCITDLLGTSPSADWYLQSESGLFLDELPGMPSVRAVDAAQTCNELAAFYQNAIETAKTDLRDDVIVGLTARFRQSNKTYVGKAGGTSFNLNEVINDTYAGVYLKTDYIRGGKLKIKTIYAMFGTPPTTLKVYRLAEGSNIMEFVKDITPSPVITANTAHSIASTEVFDLDGYQYFLLYATSGVVAKNNSISCGCGGIERDMAKYLSLVGVSGDDLADFSTWAQTSSTAHGLAFEIEVGCDASNILCELYDSSIDYKSVIPHAIRYKAAEIAIEKILSSDEVNRFTMMSREHLYGKRNHFRKEYLDRVTWMTETIDIASFTDCYVCNTKNSKMQKSGLLV